MIGFIRRYNSSDDSDLFLTLIRDWFLETDLLGSLVIMIFVWSPNLDELILVSLPLKG